MADNLTPGDRVTVRADAAERGLAPRWMCDPGNHMLGISLSEPSASVLHVAGEHAQIALDQWVTDHHGEQITPWLHRDALDGLGS